MSIRRVLPGQRLFDVNAVSRFTIVVTGLGVKVYATYLHDEHGRAGKQSESHGGSTHHTNIRKYLPGR